MADKHNSTPILYQGTVLVDICIGDRVFSLSTHNEGEEGLKKAFAKFLTGNFSYYDIPYYLDLKSTDDIVPSTGSWTSYLVNDIPLTGKQYKKITSTNNWQAVFTAAIPYSSLSHAVDPTTTTKFRFYLQTQENTEEQIYKQDLAWIDVAAVDLANIQEGAQALVYWRMMLLNVSEIDEV